MTELILTNAEKNGFRGTSRMQPLIAWLYFLNVVTITTLIYLFLKIFKTLRSIYEWIFPCKHELKCPVIVVLGPQNNIIQQIVYQLSRTFDSDITIWEDLNANFSQALKSKKNPRKGQIIYSNTSIVSREGIYDFKMYIQKTFGFVDILIISQNERPPDSDNTHAFLNHLNQQLLAQFWMMMAFLPGMLKKNRGHILSIAFERTSFINTGIIRSVHEELLQCESKVKLTLVEISSALNKYYLPSLSSDVLASLILRSMWNSGTVVKVPSLPSYLTMLPVLLVKFLMNSIVKIINLTIVRSS